MNFGPIGRLETIFGRTTGFIFSLGLTLRAGGSFLFKVGSLRLGSGRGRGAGRPINFPGRAEKKFSKRYLSTIGISHL